MKRSRLNRMSKKRRSEIPQRRAVVAAVLDRDGHECQAKALIPDVKCWGPLDCHELIPRGCGGDYLDPSNCKAICRGHHSHITDHPAEAYELGLLRRRGDDRMQEVMGEK